MKKKTLIISMAFLISIFLLSSCSSNSIKLSERALVQGIGLDTAKGEIVLTMQIFSPSGGNKGNISATSDNARIIESKGPTLALAVKNATLIQGKQIFLGHARVIIIGEKLAQSGLSQTLDFLTSNNFTRQNASVIICKGEAADILTTKINQGIVPCEMLEKLIINNKENGFVQNVKLYNFSKSLKNKHESASLPMIQKISDKPQGLEQEEFVETSKKNIKDETKEKSEEIDNVSSIKVYGTAVFVNGKMVDTLSHKQTRGLLWIRDEVKKTTISVSDDNYASAAIGIYNSKSKISPSFDGEKIMMQLKVEALGGLNESILNKETDVEFDDLKNLELACEQVIIDEAYNAFSVAIIQNKADVFNFGNIVNKYNVKLWKSMRLNWSESVKNIELNVQANVIINRVGTQFKRKW